MWQHLRLPVRLAVHLAQVEAENVGSKVITPARLATGCLLVEGNARRGCEDQGINADALISGLRGLPGPSEAEGDEFTLLPSGKKAIDLAFSLCGSYKENSLLRRMWRGSATNVCTDDLLIGCLQVDDDVRSVLQSIGFEVDDLIQYRIKHGPEPEDDGATS
jgi:hypothetical protein